MISGEDEIVVWSGCLQESLQLDLARAGYAVVSAEQTRLTAAAKVVVVEPDVLAAVPRVVYLRNARFPGKVVAVCEARTPRDIQTLLTAGASGIVSRTPHTDVAFELDQFFREKAQPASQEPLLLPFRLDPNSRVFEIGVVVATLRPSEFALLRCLAQRPGRWHKAPELIKEALGTNHRHDSSLVRVHAHRIRQQLGMAHWCLRGERSWGYMFTTNVDAGSNVGLRSRGSGWQLPADTSSRGATLTTV